jgi:hypothetical protein
MNRITTLYLRVVEGRIVRRCARLFHKGQTLTEYALLLSGVGIVAYSGYKTMGNAIKSLLTTVDGQL